MRHNGSDKLFDYWNNLRGGRPAPDRREIEPSDIREMLGDTFILELDREFGCISFRLAGTRLCNVYGKELKGEGFLSLWQEEDNLQVFEIVQQVFDTAKPCVIHFAGETRNGKTIHCEMTLFPLANGADDSSRILGASFQLTRADDRTPDVIVLNKLKDYKFLTNGALHNAPPLTPVILSYPEHKPLPRHIKRVRHLTVIEGGLS